MGFLIRHHLLGSVDVPGPVLRNDFWSFDLESPIPDGAELYPDSWGGFVSSWACLFAFPPVDLRAKCDSAMQNQLHR